MRFDKEAVADWIADWKTGATTIFLVGLAVGLTWLIGSAVASLFLSMDEAKVWGAVAALILAPGHVASLGRR